MSLVPADIVFALLVLVLMVRGAIRGFVAETLSMAALVAAVVAALVLMGPVAAQIERNFGPSIWSRVMGFLLVFVVVYLLVKLLEGGLHRLLVSLHLEQLDRALGLILGAVEGVLVVSALIIILDVQPFFDAREVLEDSLFVRFLAPVLGLASGSFGVSERTTT